MSEVKYRACPKCSAPVYDGVELCPICKGAVMPVPYTHSIKYNKEKFEQAISLTNRDIRVNLFVKRIDILELLWVVELSRPLVEKYGDQTKVKDLLEKYDRIINDFTEYLLTGKIEATNHLTPSQP